jgi:hypothetical protein
MVKLKDSLITAEEIADRFYSKDNPLPEAIEALLEGSFAFRYLANEAIKDEDKSYFLDKSDHLMRVAVGLQMELSEIAD